MKVYKIEELTEKDAEEIEFLFKEVWPNALEYPQEWRKKRCLTKSEIIDEMRKGYHYFGVRINGKIVGLYKLSIEGDTCFGEHQTVHPSYRGTGLASSMYEHFIDYAKKNGYKKVRVNILLTNIPSVKCVEKFGFHKKGNPYEQAKGMLVQMYEKEV
ncbi:MAG: GNAT family N-acetyltransferase [Candidatus Bathyarchaeota archaeon]|nr:GNAT family N-acetyltransferase [Candidatus Bathyarchaeota archaeon]